MNGPYFIIALAIQNHHCVHMLCNILFRDGLRTIQCVLNFKVFNTSFALSLSQCTTYRKLTKNVLVKKFETHAILGLIIPVLFA